MTVYKDGIADNTHPLNIIGRQAETQLNRIPLYEVYMRMAEELAKRSTCARREETAGTARGHLRLGQAGRSIPGHVSQEWNRIARRALDFRSAP